jgi:bifunctional NMN adenylyltransferase/nudix hydrolase
MYDFAVFIARCEPYHFAHQELKRKGHSIADHVIMIFGSHRKSPDIRNPFAHEREEMVRACSTPEESAKTSFIYARDYPYNDGRWLAEVQHKISQVVEDISGKPMNENHIALVGCYSDESSYYLKLFPQFKLEEHTPKSAVHATEIRNLFFGFPNEDVWQDYVPGGTVQVLNRYKRSSPLYKQLADEYQFIQKYKNDHSFATSKPYPPVFVTTDAVVYQSGHVLLIRRGHEPGKGKLALPGGFLGAKEKIKDSALRELKEETAIGVPMPVLRSSIVESEVFDHPTRELRGRTITHAFFIKLPDGELPHVRAGDDAAKAFWMPVSDLELNGEEFYSDHLHILNRFMSRV